MSEIGAILVVVAIAAVPLGFSARCLAATIFEESRLKMKDKPGAHLAWFILSALAVAYFVIGGMMTHRKASDHQRRMAEQNIRQVSSEAAPSAPPDEPSM